MSAVDVREVRARMIEAADGLRAAADESLKCSHGSTYYLPRNVSTALAYGEGVLRTLAATILPPDPPDRPAQPERQRDPATGRYLPAATL